MCIDVLFYFFSACYCAFLVFYSALKSWSVSPVSTCLCLCSVLFFVLCILFKSLYVMQMSSPATAEQIYLTGINKVTLNLEWITFKRMCKQVMSNKNLPIINIIKSNWGKLNWAFRDQLSICADFCTEQEILPQAPLTAQGNSLH